MGGKQERGKILQFPGQNSPKTDSTTHVDSGSDTPQEGILLQIPTRLKQPTEPLIAIPGLDALYDPDRILIRGNTFTETLAVARDISDPNRALKAEFRLELALLGARKQFIYDMSGSSSSKRIPYRDLVDHTLGVANELGGIDAEDAEKFRQLLRDEAIVLARNFFGPNQARHIIERHDLIAIAHRTNTTNESDSPPDQTKKPNPLRIVR